MAIVNGTECGVPIHKVKRARDWVTWNVVPVMDMWVNGRVVESLDREQLHALIPESYSDLTDIYLARVRDATEVA